MARNGWSVTTSGAMTLTAATPKTVLQFVAPTNIIEVLQALDVSFDGISATAVPVIVQLLKQTTAGTMTSRTPAKVKSTGATLQLTAAENATAEPTAGDILATFHVHPQLGDRQILPLEQEVEFANGERLGVKITAPAGVNCLVTARGEE